MKGLLNLAFMDNVELLVKVNAIKNWHVYGDGGPTMSSESRSARWGPQGFQIRTAGVLIPPLLSAQGLTLKETV